MAVRCFQHRNRNPGTAGGEEINRWREQFVSAVSLHEETASIIVLIPWAIHRTEAECRHDGARLPMYGIVNATPQGRSNGDFDTREYEGLVTVGDGAVDWGTLAVTLMERFHRGR